MGHRKNNNRKVFLQGSAASPSLKELDNWPQIISEGFQITVKLWKEEMAPKHSNENLG